MTSEQHRKLKIIPLDEKQQVDSDKALDTIHDELEYALNNRDNAEKTAFAMTIETAEAEAERLRKKGKGSVEDISKICSIICKRHRIHERQIQRYFDYIDENGRQPYRKYKRRYSRNELINPTQVGNLDEADLKADDTITHLQNLLSADIDEYGRDKYHQITDLLYKNIRHSEAEFDKSDLKYINPYDTRRGDRMDAERRKITLRPADIPKDELTRLFQKWEGKAHYDSARMHMKMGDKLTKMNYISDNPRLNERLLAELLCEMITFSLNGLSIFSEFMDYWEQVKSKETLTDEDKEIIRKLLHAISHTKTGIFF